MKNINHFLTFVYVTVGICICFMIYCVARTENKIEAMEAAAAANYEYWETDETEVQPNDSYESDTSYRRPPRFYTEENPPSESDFYANQASTQQQSSSNSNGSSKSSSDSSSSKNTSSKSTSSKSTKPSSSKPQPYTGIVNINTASLEQLCSLNGIGEVTAQKIIDFRVQSGGFNSIEEIMYVSGIGEKKFEAIKDRITV